jgi:hypothetical protein
MAAIATAVTRGTTIRV